MLRDFFSGRFHVRVFDSGTYLLSAVVVDSFFVIDLPSFSRLQVSFWKGRETTFFECCGCVRLRSEITSLFLSNFHLGLSESPTQTWNFLVALDKSSMTLIFSLFHFQACAPRYVYHQHNPSKYERIEPVGTCFIAKDNFREIQEYSPCRTG
jgi:hypothetical protein